MHKGKSVLMARKLSVFLGRQLQDPEYHVVKCYTQGYSHAALAKNLQKLPEFANYKVRCIEHGVRCALIGNDDSELGEVYSGRLSEATYRKHAKKHVSMTSKSNIALQVRERKGIHGLDTTKLREFALRSTLSRGLTPWTREELAQVLKYSLQELFKKDSWPDYAAIAAELNRSRHNGQSVRSGFAVKGALQRIRSECASHAA